MMNDKTLIMIVDDEPANCMLLEQALANEYETITFASGQECLEQVAELQPDIILLDVLMPGMSGYEVCEQLRKDDETKNIPVVFVSALDTIDDRLKGYDVGGDDYLGKPVELSIVFKKIKLVLESKKQTEKLAKEVHETQEAFMTALNMGAESGMVSGFIEKSFSAQNFDKLLAVFFECMQEFDLNTVAQIRFEGEVITLNSEGRNIPLEQELIYRAQSDGRILEFGRRMFINYENFSMLIKNAPLDDPELFGRLRDHLAVVASASDARVKSIGNELNLKKHMNLSGLFKDTTVAVENIQKTLDMDFQKTLDITQRLGQEIESKVLYLGLEEDQEKLLMDIIDDSTKELIALTENKDVIKNSFADVLDTMNNALKYGD